MAFKLLYTTERGAQGDFLVDPSAIFEAGMLGTLQGTTTGSPTGLPQVTLASSGSNLVGVIDDNKTTSFLATVVNENVVAILGDAPVNLNNANVITSTFASGTASATLISATNGTISGTLAGATATGTVSYSYTIPGKAGDDTTLASGKATLWLQEGEYATDVYEVADGENTGVALTYTVGAPLYVSSNAKLSADAASTSGTTIVGFTTKAPSAGNPLLHFYLRNTIPSVAGNVE